MTPEQFLKRWGFTGTPAGDRMMRDIQRVIATAVTKDRETRNQDEDS